MSCKVWAISACLSMDYLSTQFFHFQVGTVSFTFVLKQYISPYLGSSRRLNNSKSFLHHKQLYQGYIASLLPPLLVPSHFISGHCLKNRFIGYIHIWQVDVPAYRDVPCFKMTLNYPQNNIILLKSGVFFLF